MINQNSKKVRQHNSLTRFYNTTANTFSIIGEILVKCTQTAQYLMHAGRYSSVITQNNLQHKQALTYSKLEPSLINTNSQCTIQDNFEIIDIDDESKEEFTVITSKPNTAITSVNITEHSNRHTLI